MFTRVSGNLYVVETFMPDPDEREDYVFVYYTIDNEETCTLRWIERGTALVEVGDATEIRVP